MNKREKEELLCSKYNKINRLLAIHNVNKHDREDLLQEIFEKAYENLGQLRSVDKMEAWLWTITHNTLIQYWDKRKKDHMLNPFQETDVQDCGWSSMGEPDSSPLILELEDLFEYQDLVRVLKQLSPEMLILLRLRYLEGYKLKEIAQIIGLTEAATKSRHQRCLSKLRECLIKNRWQESEEKEHKNEEENEACKSTANASTCRKLVSD